MAPPDSPPTVTPTATRPASTIPPVNGSSKASRPKDKSLPELGRELVDLTVTYAKQETIEPLKALGPRVGLGVLGSALASVGLVFVLVGVLRLVQVEARLRGLWSFLPYLVAVAVAGGVAGLALKQISSKR